VRVVLGMEAVNVEGQDGQSTDMLKRMNARSVVLNQSITNNLMYII